MRILLILAGAAIAATSAPASAQLVAGTGVTVHRGADFSDRFDRRGHRDRDHDRRDRRRDRFGNSIAIGDYGYSADFDGNRGFDPDKYNDWWHERPHRAFPRWMAFNENCQRQWWSGGAWRC